jgi:hypothetical protein
MLSVFKLCHSHALVVFTYLYRWLETVLSEEWRLNLFSDWDGTLGNQIKVWKAERKAGEALKDTKEIIPVQLQRDFSVEVCLSLLKLGWKPIRRTLCNKVMSVGWVVPVGSRGTEPTWQVLPSDLRNRAKVELGLRLLPRRCHLAS